jgi:predicted RNase H-like HicB family nuclease
VREFASFSLSIGSGASFDWHLSRGANCPKENPNVKMGRTSVSSAAMIAQVTPNTRSFTLTAILYWEEDVFVAECPEVGTASQGETIEEAIANLKEATELYLEEFPLPATTPRLMTTFEVTSA